MRKTLLFVFALVALLWMPMAKAADPATVAGKWHFVHDTEGGDRDMDAVLEQTADKVSGKWDVSASKKDGDAIAGTFADNQLTLEFAANTEVGPGTLKIKGKLADDGSLVGTWAFADYSGTFKAARTKDEPAK